MSWGEGREKKKKERKDKDRWDCQHMIGPFEFRIQKLQIYPSDIYPTLAKAFPSKYRGAICNLWSSVALWKSKYCWILKIHHCGSPPSYLSTSIHIGFRFMVCCPLTPSWSPWFYTTGEVDLWPCCSCHSAIMVEYLKDNSFNWPKIAWTSSFIRKTSPWTCWIVYSCWSIQSSIVFNRVVVAMEFEDESTNCYGLGSNQ